MNKIYNKLQEEVLKGLNANKGKANVKLYKPIDTSNIVAEMIYKFTLRHKEDKVLIFVDIYDTTIKIKNRLKELNVNLDNVKLLSVDFYKPNIYYNYKFIISVGINKEISIISRLKDLSKFYCCIITEQNNNNSFNNLLNNILPEITTSVKAQHIETANIYTPVEEELVSCNLSDEERIKYDEYTNYITTSITIFGDLYNIDKCRNGDIKNNISATDFRMRLAIENGWSTELDTSIPFNKDIDDIYNPNTLFERANNFYNITRERKNIINNAVNKLNTIKNIISDNIDKKFLIISKSGEFAKNITKYLNENNIKCLDYHDNIENEIETDMYGNAILVKSGIKKGQPKIIASTKISNNNLLKYNNNLINVLSIKNSSNVKLNCEVDIVIITSTSCDKIFDLKQRFKHVRFKSEPAIFKSLYCLNTTENVVITNKSETPIHKIISKDENLITYDKNSGDIIL